MSQYTTGGSSWFYTANDAQQGPIDADALRAMLRSGQVSPSELVWREGMSEWLPAASVPEFAAASPAPRPAAPVQEYARPVGGPIPMGYYSPAMDRPNYVGFWMRLVAYIIDYIVTYFAAFVVAVPIGFVIGFANQGRAGNGAAEMAQALGSLIGFVFSWLYFALMESSKYQGTLGKMAIGARVTDLYGNRITFGRASGRFFGKILSGILLGIGFIMVGVTERKQGLHDQLASTLVLKGRAG